MFCLLSAPGILQTLTAKSIALVIFVLFAWFLTAVMKVLRKAGGKLQHKRSHLEEGKI